MAGCLKCVLQSRLSRLLQMQRRAPTQQQHASRRVIWCGSIQHRFTCFAHTDGGAQKGS